ncbi:hypothetical protein [Rhodococcus tukisamuensis]|uniref:Uncharacterized protein n=1 Tax=Rhodococcus tukisamuensis TaxID=168276 RepID=A0A1G7BNL2_9NOCA|nr:hypothetical protein [Rhodococcus tukisamuensis]SDE28512.1 hypothetical protein SAMN05444580_113115 [Rhodococcus tukisamuensis]
MSSAVFALACGIRACTVAGRDLNPSFVGKFVGRHNGRYDQLGKIVDLVPLITDPRGLWQATIMWGETPTERSSVQKLMVPFGTTIEFLEIAVDAKAGTAS